MHNTDSGASDAARRLFVYNGGFLTQSRIRRILRLAGWRVTLGRPGVDDWVGVWGKSPTAPRGETVATRINAPLLRVEDSFLRSILPGRTKEPPMGLNIDQTGVHFDSTCPSDLETLLATHPLDDTALLNRARAASARIKRLHLSKYNAFDPDAAVPDAPYVLVIDQTRGDASIEHGGANAASFAEMLVFAQTEHPGNKVVIKSHAETIAGHRDGHFGPNDETDRVSILRDPVSPWALMEGATAVYTVSSQLGFEAIFAGHKPRVFGQPFYAGWGLTQDEYPCPRRQRALTRAQMFAASMILYPTWYDPYRDRLCDLETVIDTLEAQSKAWRDDHLGYVAVGMSRWKRPHLKRFFTGAAPLRFAHSGANAAAEARANGRKLLVWASKENAFDLPTVNTAPVVQVEDGFIRSNGLGARLVAPLSLVLDDLGIYYDPQRESRLERLITASVALPDDACDRAAALVQQLIASGVSKYNTVGAPLPDLPVGQRILVPGQVEDDASILLGCSDVSTNLVLLARARVENPDAVLLYKPHPDVEAGLRRGKIDAAEAMKYADQVLTNADPIALIDAVDQVWTMTSTLGFEALIRRKQVTCLGAPFYAGWGLTRDLSDVPARRQARPDLNALVHACLIDYPRYLDPVTGLACPVEVALQRLNDGVAMRAGWSAPVWAWGQRFKALTRFPGRK